MSDQSSSIVLADEADWLFTANLIKDKCKQPTPKCLVAYPSLSINIDKVFPFLRCQQYYQRWFIISQAIVIVMAVLEG